MAETESNIAETERFIAEVLEKNFNQKIDPEDLKSAAKKLRAAIPQLEMEAA